MQRLPVAGDEDEDTRLWRCVQGGDAAAFEALVQRYGAKLASVASRLLPNRAATREESLAQARNGRRERGSPLNRSRRITAAEALCLPVRKSMTGSA